MRWSRVSEQILPVDKSEPLPRLGCEAEGQRVEEDLIGCGAVKARVRPAAIVEVEVAAERCARLGDAGVGSEIDLMRRGCGIVAGENTYEAMIVSPHGSLSNRVEGLISRLRGYILVVIVAPHERFQIGRQKTLC